MKYIYGLIICMIIPAFFFAGYETHSFLHPEKKAEVIVKNVDKPVYKTVYVPQSQDEWKAWAESPILIDRELKGNIYSIYAHDGYKETRVKDKIEISSFGDWKVYACIGAAAACGVGIITMARK